MIKNKSEQEFENAIIEHLTSIGGVKQWRYEPSIKTTNALWDNFKHILEINNQARLDAPLSNTEFNQVKKIISELETPYKAGQFLYGMNGVSEVEVRLDDGKLVFLTVFDQAQVGGGNTVYQVVNQIKRDRIIDGKQNRRFDITLLINGLPIIQIEAKKAMHSAVESLNQMKQYIAERQFSDIFSTLQVLVAMTPHDIRYMANSVLSDFNTAFAFNWQDKETAKPIRSWREFSNQILSIPMAHNLATRYMILDGTKNRESIKVMRPYQVYATQEVLDKVTKHDFTYNNDDGKLGYIWHTTGSGKTITSFKTAWLASRLPNVDKVIFLVDRIALTNQTVDSYRAYDPIAGFEGKTGVINDTANVNELHKKLRAVSDKNIIVTSIQKMAIYVKKKKFKKIEDNVLFIVDEAHRSTGDGVNKEGMLNDIREAMPKAAWVGYTGTPKFPETQLTFGPNLHAYTIKEAIADGNVLGFNVEFKETIVTPESTDADDFDDMVKGSAYDLSEEHVDLVVSDIVTNWKKRSNDYKYNAMLTVHVGGNRASTPRVMEYYNKFKEYNEHLPEGDRLKVAVSFSQDTSNSDRQLDVNTNLHAAIVDYNAIFGTSFDMGTVSEYTNDVTRRLNRSADDGKYLDLLIVIDQLLTGFDAPQLNTLYVDRTFRGYNLIQAYSRTNRIHNSIAKPWGNVINYRWPKQNEYEMNKSFAIYSDRNSANVQMEIDELLEDMKASNTDGGILSAPYSEIKKKLAEVIKNLASLTNNFNDAPASERDQEIVFENLNEYNSLMSKLKQYSVDEDGNEVDIINNPFEFEKEFGMNEDQEIILTTVIADKIKRNLAEREDIDISQVNLSMVHIKDVRINYDYLVDLIVDMANEIKANRQAEADKIKEAIDIEIARSDSEEEKSRYRNFVEVVYSGSYTFDKYPVVKDTNFIEEQIDKAQRDVNRNDLTKFINKWGLHESTTPNYLSKLIKKHRVGAQDLDKQGELNKIINAARDDYKDMASDEVALLSWIKYRNELRLEFFDLADKIVKRTV